MLRYIDLEKIVQNLVHWFKHSEVRITFSKVPPSFIGSSSRQRDLCDIFWSHGDKVLVPFLQLDFLVSIIGAQVN